MTSSLSSMIMCASSLSAASRSIGATSDMVLKADTTCMSISLYISLLCTAVQTTACFPPFGPLKFGKILVRRAICFYAHTTTSVIWVLNEHRSSSVTPRYFTVLRGIIFSACRTNCTCSRLAFPSRLPPGYSPRLRIACYCSSIR